MRNKVPRENSFVGGGTEQSSAPVGEDREQSSAPVEGGHVTKFRASRASEYKFELKEKDVYGALIVERLQMPLSKLADAALEAARKASPDLIVSKKEYRIVNGKNVMFMQFEGTIDGVKFVYCGYYFSSYEGIVQLITTTGKNLLEQFKPQMEELLNGFTQEK